MRLNKIPQTTRENESAVKLLEQEREGLLPKPPIFDSARIEEPRVDKYSTILIDSCHYSVPDNLVGKKIFVKVYSNRILCFYENEKVCEKEKVLTDDSSNTSEIDKAYKKMLSMFSELIPTSNENFREDVII